MRRLSRTMWRLCRGREAIAGPRPPWPILEPLRPEHRAGLGLRQPRHPADDRRPSTSAAIELARAGPGDRRAAGRARGAQRRAQHRRAAPRGCLGRDVDRLLRRALEIAVAAGLDEQAGRAFANLLRHLLRPAAVRRGRAVLRLTASPTATTTTSARSALPARRADQRAGGDRPLGRGGGAERASCCAAIVASTVNRLNPLLSLGKIRARRGEPGAWECLDEAAAAADGSGEAQWIVPVRLARAEAYWLEGQASRGQREARAGRRRRPPVRRLGARARSPSGCSRTGVALARRAVTSGRALPAAARRPRGEGRAAVDRPGLPVRGRAGPARRGDEPALREALRIFTDLGASADRPDHPAEDAPARHPVDPGRAAHRDPCASARADPPRARGPRPDLRRAHQRRDRRASCSSRRRPSIITSPPCWPSWAPRPARRRVTSFSASGWLAPQKAKDIQPGATACPCLASSPRSLHMVSTAPGSHMSTDNGPRANNAG